MEKLQRRIENIEKSMRKLGGEDKDKLWSTITGTNTKVEKRIQKSLNDRDIKERGQGKTALSLFSNTVRWRRITPALKNFFAFFGGKAQDYMGSQLIISY